MTPKEKAEQLIGKYFDTFVNDEEEYYSGTAWRLSKKCALIAVDEIMKAIPDASDDDSPYNHELVYWQDVKQEIEKL